MRLNLEIFRTYALHVLISSLAKLHARKVAAELGVTDGLIYLPGEPTRLYEDSDQSPPFKQRR